MTTLLEEIISASKPGESSSNRAPFEEVFLSWLTAARKRLKKRAGKALKQFSPEAISSMENALVERWSSAASSTLALELSISRLQDDLEGETPEARYLSFLQKRVWDHEMLRALFQEYHELARIVCTLLELWVEQSAEFIQRLTDDLLLLEETFNARQPLGIVKNLSQNAGDYHQGGRSVYSLTFDSGKELFYKPKDLRFGKTFHALLDEISALGLSLHLKGYAILARDKYGWEEAVKPMPCNTPEEVRRYFIRAGMLLCLLYLFDATDIHHENIIASGEYPILIDLETFFHATLDAPDKEVSADIFNHSVLKTALLPSFIEKEGTRGPDISGLTGEAAIFTVYKWKNTGTDEITKEPEVVTEDASNHRVVFKDIKQDAGEYVEEIVQGFKEMYAFIQKHAHRFTAKNGWVERLSKLPVRMVVRATRLYGYLLDRLTIPHVLLHQEERDRELEILRKLPQEKGMEHLYPLFEEEKRSLLTRDIPFFFNYPDENCLYAGEPFELKGCLDGKVQDRVMKRIEEMNEEDLEREIGFIRKAFFARKEGFHSKKEMKNLPQLPLLEESAKEDEILDAAVSIGKELLCHALRSKNGSLGWIALEPNPQLGKFELQPVGESLYGGKAGIALFLSGLYAITKEKLWKEEALNTLHSVRSAIDKGLSHRLTTFLGLGGMSGIGSVIYGLKKTSVLLEEPSLEKDALTLASSITERHLEQDRAFDIIGGAAGCILALLSLNDASATTLAHKMAKHLVEKAEPISEQGIGWKSHEGLCHLGFSHGNAGIGYALLRLGSAKDFLETVQKAYAYERGLFCGEKNNWPRLDINGMDTFPIQWCHGAVGIGFSRLASVRMVQDPHLLEEVKIALKQTENNLFLHNNLNLCCGSAGKLEFLRMAEPHFPHVKEMIARMTASLLKHYKARPPSYFDPGLMQGASGMGYTLLRGVDREGLLPQVLLLE